MNKKEKPFQENVSSVQVKQMMKYALALLVIFGILIPSYSSFQKSQDKQREEEQAQMDQVFGDQINEQDESNLYQPDSRYPSPQSVQEAYFQRQLERKRMRDQATLDVNDPLHLVH